MTFFEPELFEPELLGEGDFFTVELDLDPELDFTFVEDELFEEELFEDPLEDALLFPEDRTLLIFPRVGLVPLDFVVEEAFGIFLSPEDPAFSPVEIFTRLGSSGSTILVEVLPLESLMKGVLSLSVFNRILLLPARSAPGCALESLIRSIFTSDF